jgi:hypothetical protein
MLLLIPFDLMLLILVFFGIVSRGGDNERSFELVIGLTPHCTKVLHFEQGMYVVCKS